MFNPDGMVADARKRREPSYVAGTGPLWNGVQPVPPTVKATLRSFREALENISQFYVDRDGLMGGRAAELAQEVLLRARMAEYGGSDPT